MPSMLSATLGTMSERNSRSSDERATRELRWLESDVLEREKRLRNLETADGGGVGSLEGMDSTEASEVDGRTTAGTAGATEDVEEDAT